MRKLFLVVCLTCLLPTLANAALVAMDRLTEGDGQVTLDTATGLKWLDLNLSVPYAVDSVNKFTADGWQVATLDQVQTLFNNHFESSTAENTRIINSSEKALEFILLFGTTYVEADNQISWGRFQSNTPGYADWAIVREDSPLSYLRGRGVFSNRRKTPNPLRSIDILSLDISP